MAEYDQEEKTEEPTPKQAEKFREEGQVAKSQDVSSVLALASALGVLVATWPLITKHLIRCTQEFLGRLEMHGEFGKSVMFAGKSIIGAIAPLCIALMIIGIASQIAQFGFNFTFKPLIPSIDKFNPLPRLKTLFFSGSSLIELIKSTLKVIVIGGIAVRVLLEELENHGRLAGLSVGELLDRLGTMSLRLALQVIVALAIIAALDLLVERYRHHKKMMMTKDEIRQEHKQSEGDPLARSRLRSKQREKARRRMIDAVKNADVVVVNPTHYSVAISYDMVKDAAPKIIALGVDNLALKIRERARHEGIPVVSDPKLARGLYAKGKLGAYIPMEYFRAVATLLAWVYSITGRVA